MFNNVDEFRFEGTTVRVVKHGTESWWVNVDVCKALGYANSRQALATHVHDDDRATVQLVDGSQSRNVTVVNESGLYALIFGSQLESAKRFKRWVTSEVLPAIRKTGTYDRFDSANQTDLLVEAETLLNKVASAQNKAGERDGIYSYHKDNGWTRSEMGKMAKRELGLKGTLKDFNKLLMILGVTVAKDKNKFELAPEYYWMADDALTYNRSLRSRMPNGNPHFNAAGKERLFEMIRDLREERELLHL